MRRRIAFLALVLALALAGCSRPPDDVVRRGIERNVQMQAVRINPFVNNGETKILSYKITNTYKKSGAIFYEYEAEVSLVAQAMRRKEERTMTIRGIEAFSKEGNRWRAIEVQ